MQPHTATSTAILEGLRDRDNRTVWEAYVGRYRPLLIGYCKKLGLTGTDADDVAQEALLAFAKRYREGAYDRERGRLRAWLFGIVRNALADWRRQRPARDVQPATEGTTGFFARIPDGDRLADLWEEEWRKAVVRQCMEAVSSEVEPTTYRAFELFACQGWSAAQVAEHLGITTNAVFLAKHRVLRRMRTLHPSMDELW